MTTAELMFRRLESQGMRELSRLYLTALTKQAKGEPNAMEWAEFGRMLTRILALSHLTGRLSTVNRVGGIKIQEMPFNPGELAAYDESTAILTGPFVSALNWFLNKVPALRRNVDKMLPAAKKRAFWVTGVEQHEALERIQARLSRPLAAEPGGMSEFIHTEADITGLAEAHLETVYRTNTQAALAEGQMDQMRSPELRDGVALVQLNEIHDSRTRGNPSGLYPDQGRHWQMDGFVESPDHPIWDKITPPNGYQCRATLYPVTWLTAERMGLARGGVLLQEALDRRNAAKWEIIRSGQYPDPSFK